MYNKESGYGKHTQAYPFMGGGKVFVVAKSASDGRQIMQDTFKVDPDGINRFAATIDAAIGYCEAGRGDVIYVAPDHTENISAATSLVADVDGVSIIGIGQGLNRPTLTYTDTAGSIELDGDNVTFENFRLLASVSAVVVGINVDGDGCTLRNIEMDFDATGDDFITMIDVDGVNDTTIEGCHLIAEDTAGCDEAIRLDDADNTTIKNCRLYGDFTDGAIIGEGAAGSNLLIADNYIYNSDTTAGFVIDLNVAFTGLLVKNNCGTLFATAPETTFDPGSCLCIENYVCNAVDESGALVPVTVST